MKHTIALFLLLLLRIPVASQPTNPAALFKSKLELINRQWSSAYVTEKVENIVGFFEADAVCMPEYQPSIKGTNAIGEYYRAIFNRRQTRNYDKKITEVINLNTKVAEIGTFTVAYQDTADGPLITLHGKYMNVWTVSKNGDMKLKAESYGYFKNADDPASHVVKIAPGISGFASYQPNPKDAALTFRLRALNALMEKAVQHRDGNLRADFFAQDAVFMPFADSMKVGMQVLRPYLIQYNSHPVTIESIRIYNDYTEDCGDYVIEYPMFKVKWRANENKGSGSGKGIRIWRKEPDCSLKIFREIGVHDHLEQD